MAKWGQEVSTLPLLNLISSSPSALDKWNWFGNSGDEESFWGTLSGILLKPKRESVSGEIGDWKGESSRIYKDQNKIRRTFFHFPEKQKDKKKRKYLLLLESVPVPWSRWFNIQRRSGGNKWRWNSRSRNIYGGKRVPSALMLKKYLLHHPYFQPDYSQAWKKRTGNGESIRWGFWDPSLTRGIVGDVIEMREAGQNCILATHCFRPTKDPIPTPITGDRIRPRSISSQIVLFANWIQDDLTWGDAVGCWVF